MPRLEKSKRKVNCLDCGEEFEAADLGRWTRSRCPDCLAAFQKELEENEAREKREQEVFKQLERVSQAKIPLLWREVTFDSSDPTINKVAFKHCKKYAETFHPHKSPSLYLFARKYGTGKTHLAACIANHVLHDKQFSVRFQTARDLLLDIRHTFSDHGEIDEAGILNMVLGFDLLVLDDVGIGEPSGWLTDTYWTVFNRRMETGLPVVVTTNYSLHEPEKDVCLADRIGHGAVSRLKQICGENVIEFKGKDLRG